MSKYAIIDFRASGKAISALNNYFDKVIPSFPLNVNPAICGHPDIGVCKIGDDRIVVSPSVYKYYKNELPGIDVICGSSEPSAKYPDDVFYNAACGNTLAVHNFKFTDKITLAEIKQKFSKHINVEQGYSKCSICLINGDGIITDDEGIYKKLTKPNSDVLKINKGKIILKGMNYGFFGGSTGYIDKKLFLNGEIKYLDDAEIIINYLKEHNTELIEINKGSIEDIGTIICLQTKI